MDWNRIKEEVLLKCKRWCCYCEQYKGINIEVHHIVPKSDGGEDTFENAIALCFDCHADVGHYNSKHPKGNRITESELKRIRDEFYKNVDKLTRKPLIQLGAQDEINSCYSDKQEHDMRIMLWHELGSNLEAYQFAIDYAYDCWKGNFKNKYPNIHEGNDCLLNDDYVALQEEIDFYGESLYHDMLGGIFDRFKKTQLMLSETVSSLGIDMSKKLHDLIIEYMDCMKFHFTSDAGLGLVNYYWSSFFKTLDKNYSLIKCLKEQIDESVRMEYELRR